MRRVECARLQAARLRLAVLETALGLHALAHASSLPAQQFSVRLAHERVHGLEVGAVDELATFAAFEDERRTVQSLQMEGE